MANPRDAKACRKLRRFDVKTSCRQVNELFEVMQQPSAPSGEWYWRILLESSLFSPPHTCLMPNSGGTPCTINIICTSLKSTFSGLQFCRRHYWFKFIHLAIVAFQNREITRNTDKIWPHSRSRSSKVIHLCVVAHHLLAWVATVNKINIIIIHLGVNRKLIYDFLLVINSNFGPICSRFRDIDA